MAKQILKYMLHAATLRKVEDWSTFSQGNFSLRGCYARNIVRNLSRNDIALQGAKNYLR